MPFTIESNNLEIWDAANHRAVFIPAQSSMGVNPVFNNVVDGQGSFTFNCGLTAAQTCYYALNSLGTESGALLRSTVPTTFPLGWTTPTASTPDYSFHLSLPVLLAVRCAWATLKRLATEAPAIPLTFACKLPLQLPRQQLLLSAEHPHLHPTLLWPPSLRRLPLLPQRQEY
jgi:hypothetical protein